MKYVDSLIWVLGHIWGTSFSLKVILFLHKYYWNPFQKNRCNSLVLYALDSEYYSCGFADRLRGMVSAYALSKALHIDFYIMHKSPFQIENYLQPHQINWKIEKNDIVYNAKYTTVYISLNLDGRLPWMGKYHRGQLHYYSNRDILSEINKIYSTDYKFDLLFNELFTTSNQLLNAIQEDRSILGDNYVSVSFRFVNLLGDFKEGRQLPLGVEEQQMLIGKCVEIIETVKRDNIGVQKVLVTADSMRFLDFAVQLEGVYVIPGKTTHSGHVDNNNEGTLKTFKDFILISEAKKVYLGIVGNMYNSNFARTAAMTQGKEFKIIRK